MKSCGWGGGVSGGGYILHTHTHAHTRTHTHIWTFPIVLTHTHILGLFRLFQHTHTHACHSLDIITKTDRSASPTRRSAARGVAMVTEQRPIRRRVTEDETPKLALWLVTGPRRPTAAQ